MNGKALCCLSVAGTELWSLSVGLSVTTWPPLGFSRVSTGLLSDYYVSLSLSLSLSLARSAQRQSQSLGRALFLWSQSVRGTISLSLSLSLCFGFGNHNLIHNIISS